MYPEVLIICLIVSFVVSSYHLNPLLLKMVKSPLLFKVFLNKKSNDKLKSKRFILYSSLSILQSRVILSRSKPGESNIYPQLLSNKSTMSIVKRPFSKKSESVYDCKAQKTEMQVFLSTVRLQIIKQFRYLKSLLKALPYILTPSFKKQIKAYYNSEEVELIDNYERLNAFSLEVESFISKCEVYYNSPLNRTMEPELLVEQIPTVTFDCEWRAEFYNFSRSQKWTSRFQKSDVSFLEPYINKFKEQLIDFWTTCGLQALQDIIWISM